VPEERKQDDDRQRNSQQPEQCTTSESHVLLLFVYRCSNFFEALEFHRIFHSARAPPLSHAASGRPGLPPNLAVFQRRICAPYFAPHIRKAKIETLMSKPLVVTIPHRLGKDEALTRLKSGFTSARMNFGYLLTVQEEVWTDDHLQFRVSALGQVAQGTIDVAPDHVRLEVMLPWLLAAFAERIAPAIRKEGTLLLDKK
jgi:Putative polyhydroxyalkanoic acid system protein (PHA_gran_rgn)